MTNCNRPKSQRQNMSSVAALIIDEGRLGVKLLRNVLAKHALRPNLLSCNELRNHFGRRARSFVTQKSPFSQARNSTNNRGCRTCFWEQIRGTGERELVIKNIC